MPQHVIKNPVMFVVEIGSVLTTLIWLRDMIAPDGRISAALVHVQCQLSGCGSPSFLPILPRQWRKDAVRPRRRRLRKMRQETVARRLVNGKREETVPASALRKGDVVVVEAGEIIPGDGDVIEGIASVDESAITGESAPVIRESGGDRSAVTGGTKVLSDRIVVRITASPGESFLDRMIALVEGAERQKTPNEIALNILLAGLDAGFSVCLRDPRADGALFRHAYGFRNRDRRVARLFDSDDDRRIAFRHRHRRHRSFAAQERSGDERPRGGSCGRRGHVAAWIRPGRSRSAIAWPLSLSPSMAPAPKPWPMRRSCRAWRMKHRKGDRLWCWQGKIWAARARRDGDRRAIYSVQR